MRKKNKARSHVPMKQAARLLDANLNRAREGLRVLEETARFVWNDKATYTRLRRLRHRLHDVTASVYRELVFARDSERDAGRAIREGARVSIAAIVSANIRRAQEAVRVLEEYSKIFAPASASVFKEIRYRLYVEEKRLLKRS